MASADRKKLSELLKDVLAEHRDERISLRALAHDLHRQGMPLLMAIFAIPMCIPIPYPPGFSTFVATCISVFAVQLFTQRPELWIPRWISSKTISRELVDRIIAKALPKIERFEHIFKSRWLPLVSTRATKCIAGVTLLMNLVIATPLPGIHFFPGWAIIIMCIGLLYRDGKVVAAGLAMAVWGLVFASGEIWLGREFLKALFGWH